MANKTPKGANARAKTGNGGETHQNAGGPEQWLTTNQGTPISDNQNSLKSGERGPDAARRFHPAREDHPFRPRAHPRAHRACARLRGARLLPAVRSRSPSSRKAAFLQDPKKKTPVFVRFSTVAGGAGSVDLPRDVRGFAVKFYTEEGNFDLVGNNIPVFFIQDAIKFPDLIHSVKMEPDRGFPQAGSAHDTFWDFASLMPESMHMLMWAMSDRAIPRSFRMMEGFGVHTFRLVDAKGKSTFVKFHWRPIARRRFGALGRGGEDQRRRSRFPSPRPVRRDRARRFPRVGVLYSGVRPENRRRVRVRRARRHQADPRGRSSRSSPSARWCSTATPTTSSPRPSRSPSTPATWCRASTSPTTRCCRAGCSPTPTPSSSGSAGRISTSSRSTGRAARCATSSATASSAMNVPTGRVAYEPNSLDPAGPRESAERGFATYAEQESGDKQRIRPESFADHYSQARLFFRSMTRAGAAPHRQRLRLRARQGRDRGDPQAHARPPDDHRADIGRRGRGSARHGGRSRTAHAGARSDRSRRVARPEPDQEGEADAARAARSAC